MDEIRLTVAEVERFRESNTWKFILQEFQVWMNDIVGNLKEEKGIELYRAQGRAQVLDLAMLLPQTIIDALMAQAQYREELDEIEDI